MISTEIEFSAPETVAAALSVLAEHEYDATALSCGMSPLPMMNLRLATPEPVVSAGQRQLSATGFSTPLGVWAAGWDEAASDAAAGASADDAEYKREMERVHSRRLVRAFAVRTEGAR